MADKSEIEWTDATWNPIRGCSVVSEGCRNCYAMSVAARFSGEGYPYEGLAYRNESGAHWTGKVKLIDEHLEDPLRWKRPRRIFVNSMSDLFHESIPTEWILRIFEVMAYAKQHVFQVLTKRPERMKYLLHYPDDGKFHGDSAEHHRLLMTQPLSNVWLGVSCEDQKTADGRIPLLLQTPATIKWVSAEPLLGPIDLSIYMASGFDTPPQNDILNWVVVGGESGPSARPMHPDWARSLRDQCVAAGAPFFFKQWGAWLHESQTDKNLWRQCVEAGVIRGQVQRHVEFGGFTYRVGKKNAGRLLDGREWNEYPDIAMGGA
jgi:protein gp37